ncbi:MAG: hypothetical protein Q8M71_13455 [Thermodesulfovibrionales bacterium]|nr:hypothetical protein [Thermodesulfovibrionales bacterium]
MSKGLKWLYRFLASRELAIGLFSIICLYAVPGTFIEKTKIYSGPVFKTLIGLIGLNLLLCTLQKVKSLSRPVLVMHSGVIFILAGTVVSSFGFVATVNVYEGTTADKFYRWDINKDVSLGMDLAVKKINIEYYPIPVKVGVLKNGEKGGLFTLKTGETFDLENYRVRVDALEFPSENLKLSVFSQDHFIGSARTSGDNNLPSDFPYKFVLVAFKNPSLKRTWLDLMLSRNSSIIAEGTSEVNSPFKWEDYNFSYVKGQSDRYGIPFAGIQITKDPGKPFVYFGFVITGIGVISYVLRRLGIYGR